METYDKLPKTIQSTLDSFNEDAEPYKECDRIKQELESKGYTADYGLDGSIDNVKLKVDSIAENNKLIAEFMEDRTLYEDSDLKYHTSWGWLIPVVQKVKDSQIFGTQHLIDNIDNVLCCDLEKSTLYESVLDFIKQYNK